MLCIDQERSVLNEKACMHMTLKVSVLRNGHFLRRLVIGIFTIKDDAFGMPKSLAMNEGLLVGSSSGASTRCIEFKSAII